MLFPAQDEVCRTASSCTKPTRSTTTSRLSAASSPSHTSPARKVRRGLDRLSRATKARGSRGYFAVAQVEAIVPDPTALDMYLALIAPGTYLDFVRRVPFSGTLFV